MRIADIQDVVCRRFNISRAMLLGARRKRDISTARFVAYWLAIELFPQRSMAQIARSFRRDRTTIIHGHQRWRDLALRDQALIDRIQLCIADLREIVTND